MDTVYKFVKHCMADEEFGCGGIPTKETYYLKKLGWSEAEIHKFYEAMCTIKFMNDDANRKEKERESESRAKRLERLEKKIARARRETV